MFTPSVRVSVSVNKDITDLQLYYLLPASTKLGQGNVFTGGCDSVHRGVCLSACWDTSPQEQTSQEQTPWNRHPLRADPSEADSGIQSMSGRYASYWNAFLYRVSFENKSQTYSNTSTLTRQYALRCNPIRRK